MLIVDPGHTWVTDLGRTQGPSLGFSINGALDQFSATLANILVGNNRNTALLEATQLGLTFTAEQNLLIAVTGAECAITINDRPAPKNTPLSVHAGQTVHLGYAQHGLRNYVAVRGGINAPQLLGSCARDSMLSFGTQLQAGDHLEGPVDTPELQHPVFGLPLFRFAIPETPVGGTITVDTTDGPDLEEFGDTASLLYKHDYLVGPRSNHVGLRLSGVLPTRQATGEVLSRGVPVGAIEVPSSEGLLVLHRGRGVTAGYPVLAVVTATGLDAIGQVQPGQHVRFRRVDVDQARSTYLDRAIVLDRLEQQCSYLLATHGVATQRTLTPAA
ncbi:biotin-dependent carboxyltransferase family protein [Microbacterium sp. YY-01]|uniref:5-oxoprolinase subunit C family protein n=1 Tax=Microbacterium sp. YY-01 TaxID=3421634 RepID=UPI003D181DE0